MSVFNENASSVGVPQMSEGAGMPNDRTRRRIVLGTSALGLHLASVQHVSTQPATVQSEQVVTPSYPAWLRHQRLFTWFEIPGTKLSSVDPAPAPPGHTRNKVDAWNGAALETRGSVYWMGLSGGHADYAGNEINRIRLGVDAPRWEQVRAPSRLDFSRDGRNWDVPYYEDGTPASRHTYGNQQFINAEGRLCWVGGGAIWGSGGRGSNAFDYWDVEHRRFGTYANALQSIGQELRGPEVMVVKHPITEDIYFSRGDGPYLKWFRSKDRWEKIKDFGSGLGQSCAAIDPRTGILMRIGQDRRRVGVFVHGFDADTGREAPKHLRISGAAANWFESPDPKKARGGALEWCAPLERFVYYCGFLAAGQVIAIDPLSWNAEYLPTSGPAPAKGANLHYNRFRYAPELRACVLVDGWDANIKCLRIAA